MKPTNLVPCRTCAEPISRFATRCPYCAQLLPTLQIRGAHSRIATIVVLFLGALVALWVRTDYENEQARVAAEHLRELQRVDAQVQKWETMAATARK